MRHALIAFLCVNGVAVGLQPFCSGDGVLGQEKKAPSKEPAEKATLADIERLIKELGSTSLAIREKASKRLQEIPGALPVLRRALEGNDLETRRRLEVVIEALTQSRFRRLMAGLAKEKSEAQLDVLTDVLLENRKRVEDEDWKITVEVVTAIAEKISKGTKIRQLPDEGLDYRYCHQMIGGSLTIDRATCFRVIADRVDAPTAFSFGLAVVSQRVDAQIGISGSIVLMNGDAPPKGTANGPTSGLGGTFVFCDSDLSCVAAPLGCIIICAGGFTPEKAPIKSIIIEQARKSSKINLFSSGTLGLKLTAESKGLRVEKVSAESRSESWGLKAGDLIQIEHGGENAVSKLERSLRRCSVTGDELYLKIQRGAKTVNIVASFPD